MSEKQLCCVVMRINLDCNACCRRARRIILRIKEIETHMIDKQECRVIACGRFRASDVAIKLRRKMKRRVEILEVQEFNGGDHGTEQQQQQQPPPDNEQRYM